MTDCVVFIQRCYDGDVQMSVDNHDDIIDEEHGTKQHGSGCQVGVGLVENNVITNQIITRFYVFLLENNNYTNECRDGIA